MYMLLFDGYQGREKSFCIQSGCFSVLIYLETIEAITAKDSNFGSKGKSLFEKRSNLLLTN